ncbi:hypothetical protein [Brevibacillus sp. AY1]|uniref:hypothetical protein n=1 Tax=Brevibacillus sp. AY1 TaxID=2807621 RepID=UPI002456C0EA|nr:hypothetical protein [Brevibacillus sp. AY1]MDH4618911.1 hypothetical protein [Brevibacillus sp. AY1]
MAEQKIFGVWRSRKTTFVLLTAAIFCFGVPDSMSQLRAAEQRVTMQTQENIARQVKKMIQLPDSFRNQNH